MITLHRLNKAEFILNADLIETIESTPDTMITLTTGKKLIVRDGIEDVIGKAINYRQLCNGAIRVATGWKKDSSPDDTGANNQAGAAIQVS